MDRQICNTLNDYNQFCTENRPYGGSDWVKNPPATFPCLLIHQYHDNYNGPDWMDLEIIERSDIPAPLTLSSMFSDNYADQPITA